MSLVLASSGGGSITLQEPVTASNLTQELAAVAGTLAPLVSATAQASTSGTVRDFTGIPSWAKRVTVMFSNVSTTGTSEILVRLGTAGGFVASGYDSSSRTAAGTDTASTVGFIVSSVNAAANVHTGTMVLTLINGNLWVETGIVKAAVGGTFRWLAGLGDMGGVVTQLRVTTVNGTDTFDGGTINIMYE